MIDRKSQPKIALAHDWLVGMRGGEWVLDRLAQQFGPTDLYVLVDDHRPLTPAISACRVHTSLLQRFPGGAGRLRRHYLPLMPWAVGRIRVERCDLLISTSSSVMKSIHPPPNVPHLCYCHSPARYIWEQTEDYARGEGGRLRGLGLRMLQKRFQEWDRRTATRVTKFLANSAHTAARIKRCFDRDADVVYPPVRTEFFTQDSSVPREEWLLVVAALEPYKRTDMVIDAANQAKFPLKVVGGGSQLNALRERAGPTVEVLGRVDDESLRELYRRARALVFPQIEDFGIVPVEAQACGCPVLAFDAGGAKETVTGDTGYRFPEQSAEAIVNAVKVLGERMFHAAACRTNAERFSGDAFDARILDHVKAMLAAAGHAERNN